MTQTKKHESKAPEPKAPKLSAADELAEGIRWILAGYEGSQVPADRVAHDINIFLDGGSAPVEPASS